MISGPRLRQAREAVLLTQKELAERTGIVQPLLSKIEAGVRLASRQEALSLAEAVQVPVRFLLRDPILLPEGSLGLFRSTSSKVKSAEYTAARRIAEIGAEVIGRLGEGMDLPPVRIRPVGGCDEETAATYARSMLRLPPEEPIKNLTVALERSGAFVLRIKDISPHISGFGAWLDPSSPLEGRARPLIATRRPLGPFRLRFTLAHELGHLILDHQVFGGPKATVEREANLFAQALLMPRDAALEDLTAASLDMERLAILKGKWGVSMNAIAMRAKHLGVIGEPAYYSIYEGLRVRGWLKCEPGDSKTACEEPGLMTEIAQRRKVPLDAYALAEASEVGLKHVRALLAGDQEMDLTTLTTA